MRIKLFEQFVTETEGTAQKLDFAKYMRLLKKGVASFGSNLDIDFEDKFEFAVHVARSLEADSIPVNYSGLPYDVAKQMKEILPWYHIEKMLDPKQLAKVKEAFRPVYEGFSKSMLTDYNYEKYIKEKLKRAVRDKQKEEQLLGASLKDMPELFNHIKEMIHSDSSVQWDSLKVIDLKSLPTEHSTVVSSSFSTYYYYSVKVSFMGKEFTFDKVRLGSDHFSGGWN